MAVGASFETSPGKFNEIYFYDDEINHPEDGKLIEDAYAYDYLNQHQKRPFPTPSRRMKLRLRTAKVQANSATGNNRSRKRKMVSDVAEYFETEAADVGNVNDGDDCDETGNLDVWDIDDPCLDPVQREERQERLRQQLLQSDNVDESSAVAKFLAFFLDPQYSHSTFLAHNNARFDGILLLRYVLQKNVMAKALFDGRTDDIM